MSKVLNISNRLEDKKRKQQLETHQEKMETLQRVVRCSSCHFKCAMCGYHLNTAESPPVQSFFPSKLYLCESCLAEYKEYMEIISGKEGSDIFWHNREWVELWSAWFDFQQAINKFKYSAEFEQLLEELDN